MIYANEIKLKDLPQSHLKLEIETLLKTVMMDFGSIMAQDVFSHTVNRLAYLVSMKYKGLMLGEVKYVFEMAPEQIKGKLSVQTIMQLFLRYFEAKIEKQRQEFEDSQFENFKNSVDCNKLPLGKAIIWKQEMYEKTKRYPETPLKEIASGIASGEIKYSYSPSKRKRIIAIEQ